MTLTEFLLARIAEDEVVAHAPGGASIHWGGAGLLIHHMSPARVLAECAAKRRIIKDADLEIGPSTAEDWLLPLLALPYADHPDYDQGWRP